MHKQTSSLSAGHGHDSLNNTDLVYVPTVVRDLWVSRILSVIANVTTVFGSNIEDTLPVRIQKATLH